MITSPASGDQVHAGRSRRGAAAMDAFGLVVAMTCLAVAAGDYYNKTTQPLSTNITTISEMTTPDVIHCAMQCSSQSGCTAFGWTQGNQTCSMYRATTVGGVQSVAADLFQRLDPSPTQGCSGDSVQGVCVCPVGRYGASCSTSFTYSLSPRQSFNLLLAYDAAHFELNGISYLLFLSIGDDLAQYWLSQSRVFVYSRDARVSSSYQLQQTIVPAGITCRGIATFEHTGIAYLVVTGSARTLTSPLSYTTQFLYQFNPASQLFFEVYRWDTTDGYRTSAYRRSNGDVFVCMTRFPSLETHLYKFNPTSHALDLTDQIALNGKQYSCVLTEFKNDLYLFLPSTSSGIYRMNANETWSLYQTIPGDREFARIDIVQRNDTILLVGTNRLGDAHYYRWDGSVITYINYFHHGYDSLWAKLVDVGGETFMLFEDILTQRSSFPVYRFNPATNWFDAYPPVAADGPDGGFTQFWYNNELYLVAVSFWDPATHQPGNANQQLFQWT